MKTYKASVQDRQVETTERERRSPLACSGRSSS
jgi:hypothetical protein